ncbi:diuretic hormone receptor-like [Teleopsis dalmanni]|uniref:diuretic hormone receptor-like n=1 Tax=Teleopsis dalmanni TaxID=139649 RepID=UPI0018CEA574|nr:diuretic hormone receptor-like [Teleopsis dalmanni]
MLDINLHLSLHFMHKKSHLGIDNFLLNNDNGQQYSYYDTQDNFNSNTNNNHNNNNNNNNENAIRSKNNNDMITGNVLKMNSTESGTHSPLSIDNIDEINQSAELQCLLQEHIETSTFGNTSDFCFTQFDTILCWPRTPRGTLAVLPCLDELQGIQYDSSQNATRFCHLNGTWEKYTNYDSCMHLPAPSPVPEFEPIVELPTIIYYIGYTISLVSLTLAIIVFAYFKELRCLRNSIHANLFFTYIMSALLWILTLSVQISIRTGLGGCIVLVTLFHFFTLTNFFWMLVEGLYLYTLVVKTFSNNNIRFNIYAIIGWGGPAIFVVVWTIAKGLTMTYPTKQLEAAEEDLFDVRSLNDDKCTNCTISESDPEDSEVETTTLLNSIEETTLNETKYEKKTRKRKSLLTRTDFYHILKDKFQR